MWFPHRLTAVDCFSCTLRCWAILGLYFGTYFRQEENAYRLTVRILDMDSQYAKQVASAPPAILGPAVVEAAKRGKSDGLLCPCIGENSAP